MVLHVTYFGPPTAIPDLVRAQGWEIRTHPDSHADVLVELVTDPNEFQDISDREVLCPELLIQLDDMGWDSYSCPSGDPPHTHRRINDPQSARSVLRGEIDPRIESQIEEFLRAVGTGELNRGQRLLSMLLEALIDAISRSENLTAELAARDEEVADLHEQIQALGVIVRALKRKLTRKRLGSVAQAILDLGLGVAGNRLDAAIFEQANSAVAPVIAECTNIVNEISFQIDIR